MKKLFIPILVLLNLAVSCDKTPPTPPVPAAPDTAMFMSYSIGNTNYNMSYVGAVKDSLSDPNLFILSATTTKSSLFPSLVFVLTKPVNGWKTSISNMDQNNQANFVEFKLSATNKCNSKNIIPTDSTGMNINFSKFSYTYADIIEGTFYGSVAPQEDPNQLTFIKNGKFRLRVN